MKLKLLLFTCILSSSFICFSKELYLNPLKKETITNSQRIINSNDSIIFDLASATLTATYLDLPIYILSDDVINSFDYALQFNLVNLTYSSTIELSQTDPTIIASAHFNTTDLFLRYTNSTLQSFPNNGVHITKIRFALIGPCTSVSAADFNNILTILNGTQCSNRVTTLNYSKFLPNAGFINGLSCLNSNVQFTDTSTITSGSISAWAWSFDDGSTSIIQNPINTFTATGVSGATLIVTASSGCMDTISNFFTINPNPVSSFSYSYNCVKDSVFFTNSSSISTGVIVSSLWDFGDLSGSSVLTNPTYQYNASTLYTVTLNSTSDYSCSSTETLLINLSNTVTANFTYSSPNNCVGTSLNFNDASTYSLNVISAWSWNFGNGASSNLQNPNYTYTQAGTYTISLESISAEGCKDTVSRKITIYVLPIVKFAITSVTTCIVANAGLTDLSTLPEGSRWNWTFGNGDTSTLQNPIYTYSAEGNYKIKVVITTTAGCTDSLTKNYNVYFPPTAEAVFSETIISTSVLSFSNLVANVKQSSWEFGDGKNSVIKNPTHKFPEIETYKICLTTYDSLDCEYISCKEVYVGLARIVAVPSSFSPNEDNINDVLNVRGGPLVEMDFKIFNEWGNLLFSSSSQEFGWDGNFNGELQPAGVYEYILKGKTADNKKINFYGAVNLVR